MRTACRRGVDGGDRFLPVGEALLARRGEWEVFGEPTEGEKGFLGWPKERLEVRPGVELSRNLE